MDHDQDAASVIPNANNGVGAGEGGVVPLVKVGGVRRTHRQRCAAESAERSGTDAPRIVTLGRLPLLPLRLIHDFLAQYPAEDLSESAAQARSASSSTPAGAQPTNHGHTVLFLLSKRLAFQFREALQWKNFFTAESVRETLSSKEHRSFVKSIHKAQLLIRTELKINEWGARDYAKYHGGMNYACAFKDNTPRVAADSVDDFIAKHEAVGGFPVVVTGLTEGWPALRKWKWHRLNRQFGGMKWRVGDDDDGYPVNVRLISYFWYTQHIAPYEDNPLYLFDSSFEDSKVASCVCVCASQPVPVPFMIVRCLNITGSIQGADALYRS